MSPETPSQPTAGDVRYYRLSGNLLKNEAGFKNIHDGLESIGHTVFAGILETARIGGRETGTGQTESVPKAEIALLEDLSPEGIEQVHKLGASIVELDDSQPRLLPSRLFPEAA